ncbi:MAG: hypothetical protein M3R17_03725 [Bacteroidota bacterium]|nr:hypothetical protein [Bacteroidota bacterium]
MKADGNGDKMDAAQMLAHCCFAMRLAPGEAQLKRRFHGRIIGPLIKKSFLSETSFKPNNSTAPELLVSAKRTLAKKKPACSGSSKSCMMPVNPEQPNIRMAFSES